MKKYFSHINSLNPKMILAIGFISGLFFIFGCKNNTNAETYAEKVMTVEEIERNNPSKFLEASGTYNESFWGDNMKVHGKVVNKATVANYKDVVIEIIFYSKTET